MLRLLVTAALLLVATTAQARWAGGDGPYSKWYDDQADCNGLKCCDIADGQPYYDGYKQEADGSVVLESGEKIVACKVIKGANPTGHAVLWIWNGQKRCFAPGSGS
jgi:hypothetical protein